MAIKYHVIVKGGVAWLFAERDGSLARLRDVELHQIDDPRYDPRAVRTYHEIRSACERLGPPPPRPPVEELDPIAALYAAQWDDPSEEVA